MTTVLLVEWQRQVATRANEWSGRALPMIVAMHRDVDHAGGDAGFLDRLDIGREPPRELDAARGNAGEDERGEIGIALDDFVRDPPQGTPERLRIEDADRG